MSDAPKPVRILRSLLRQATKRIRRIPLRVRQLVHTRVLGAEHVGRRATGRRTFSADQPAFTKTAAATAEGRASFEAEMLAHRLFADHPWMPPVLAQGDGWFSLPAFPEESRLDRVAASLTPEDRLEVARQAMGALFDIFAAGHAHRDFHGKNLFWVDGQLYVIDFEGLAPYASGRRPPFPSSYDVIGDGLDSPYHTGRMSYTRADTPSALGRLLKVPVEQALEALVADLKDELRAASLTFHRKRTSRYTCKAERIYNSFSAPHLSVAPEEAQRDSARRLARFGISAETIRGRSLLDLGCNIGGMLFETQRLGPAAAAGVEYDAEKVTVAQRVAAYNRFDTIRLSQGDVDQLTVDSVGGPFDFVYCLAISEHVKERARLFRFLAEVTRDAVYFEGNSTTDPAEARASLLGAGFGEVKLIGLSDDDCRGENNRRPLLIARRGV